MVKGISRQVILVQSPETKLFEQAIFILKEDAATVSDEMLLREAKGIINSGKNANAIMERFGLAAARQRPVLFGSLRYFFDYLKSLCYNLPVNGR